MFEKFTQKAQTREGVMLIGSIAMLFAMFAMLAVGVNAFAKADATNDGGATITVSGNGEAFATPDIARFTFTVQKDAKTMNEAQTAATADANAVVQKLKDAGIESKDIKTEGFNAFPKYEDKRMSISACTPTYCPPYNPGNPVITGYTVSTTYSVKVRNLDQAGDIAQLITASNVFSINGPDFTFDNPNKAQNEARADAIADAKVQARVLSKQLGVRLGKIVDFQVSGDGNYPIYYAKDMAMGANVESAPAPIIEPGQTDVKVEVNITYRVK